MFFQSLIVRFRGIRHVGKIFGGLNKEFWIGHFLIMVSTVLGVYLAAHSGLQSAIEFDAIISDRDNYYLRANLRDEVNYNIAITERIIKTINKIGTFDRRNYPRYQHYILETMKEQSNTLKTPNVILIGTLHYYDSVNGLLDERKRHLISYPELAEKLQKETGDYKRNVLSVLNQNLKELKTRLTTKGIKIY
jgi:hypothetical protein